MDIETTIEEIPGEAKPPWRYSRDRRATCGRQLVSEDPPLLAFLYQGQSSVSGSPRKSIRRPFEATRVGWQSAQASSEPAVAA